MKRRPTTKDWLPLARSEKVPVELPTGDAFRPEWIDFERGIRVGNLEPHERITQILKHGLESEYQTGFITDRWGRGTYWQWICWVPRADREAKPISNDVNFGCAKFFISIDRGANVFQCGLQIERGAEPARDYDWHRLIRQCAKDTTLDRAMRRLVLREGFIVRVVGGSEPTSFDSTTWTSAARVREAARKQPRGDWAGFQLYYPMGASEVRACSGLELVQAVLGAFREVVEPMNECMQIRLTSPRRGSASFPRGWETPAEGT